MARQEVIVIGGGLAGSEAAWQAARLGCQVRLYEMRPATLTPAHRTGSLAELVCSNSLGSALVDRPLGLLKAELRRMGSLIIACADSAAVPAGGALAVDREFFAAEVTRRIEASPLIDLRREEVVSLPETGPVVVATGPLTSDRLAEAIRRLSSADYLHFYDAMAPIVSLESVDMGRAFRGGRYGRGEGDYINCPLDEEEYRRFVAELIAAETSELRDFEAGDERFFDACLPVEVIARRGQQALAFGPLRPVGLKDPRTGAQPYAVVQLRQDNLAGTLYNLVGFQTNLRWSEQQRVFSMIPGLERAEFVRFGQMHRNTFLASPALLEATMQFRGRQGLFFAGQITGTEGYVGSTMSGLVAGLNAARLCRGEPPLALPPTTMSGALCRYVVEGDAARFQPMKANFGLLPDLATPARQKRQRHELVARRALEDLEQAWQAIAATMPA
ncbi:MAG TPA: methylenetetrahydrofolate--tRNA-(uracil(54)-C(5))-methyltransferase (FADH(2)-oxidizing) TrmFO [Anaerolineae bacterium]|nr:methylenetetrahydrofolate--tRNA-(uracil(54)-C(5))-methyltransferase (FADH(2)-oxidizing) TrmFO [Anaerolineae bacterium]HOQ98881.1 methylenetetrahydrofolate--tRNA-(uracil(54)-C(5))-methyltransferase (FADH(2)-oxidizing) TrmFO [Anaerolineae bacterium]HPL27396.1 methylenetetrahydrofolate--tRNA-(uracil(54)-C(5))-methyltransferase (FADH(2)-oxidizing) TrmFO [Anaerolineae bacterium]